MKHVVTWKRIQCTYTRPNSSYRYRRASIAVYSSRSTPSHQYSRHGSFRRRSNAPVKGLTRSSSDTEVTRKCSSSCVRKALEVCSMSVACDDSTSVLR